jgi:choline dehydrogenase-like flavoprotein
MDKYDYLIVGSGAGGATLARELAVKGKHPLVVETGKPHLSVGTYRDATNFYDARGIDIFKFPKMSSEGTIIWRTLMAGGSTMVSCGNGVRCLEKELSELGLDISPELAEAEDELHVAPIAKRLLSDGSRQIMMASQELGYNMELMPKFIDPKACRKCGQCTLGCAHGAKWTSFDYLKEAESNGAQIMYGHKCLSVIIEDGRARGIRARGPNDITEIMADTVIIAAGGLGTPVILQQSGIKNAGEGLFIDLLVNTYGTTDGLHQVYEPTMALVSHDFYQSQGFILSPFVNHATLIRFLELGAGGITSRDKSILGIMTKISDEPAGRVNPDGSVSKPVTQKDWKKLNEGSRISKEILARAGARNFHVSRVQGAHPGGTAAVGRVVDKNLQTEVDNLFVCDASVLPVSPGLPPILTLVALAKHLAKILAP